MRALKIDFFQPTPTSSPNDKLSGELSSCDKVWQVTELDKEPSELSRFTDLQKASIFSPQSFSHNLGKNELAEAWEDLCKEMILNYEFPRLILAYTNTSSSSLFLKRLEESFTKGLQKFLDSTSDLTPLEEEASRELKAFPELERSILKAILSIFIEDDQQEDVERVEQKILLLDEKIEKNTQIKTKWENLCKGMILDYTFSPLIKAYKETSANDSRSFLKLLQEHFTKNLEELLDSISDLASLEEEVAKNLEAFPELEEAILKGITPILIEHEQSEDVERIAGKILLLEEKRTEKPAAKILSQPPSPPLPNAAKEKLCDEILNNNFSKVTAAYQDALPLSPNRFLARLEVQLARSIMKMAVSDIQTLEENVTKQLKEHPELQRAILKGIAPGIIDKKEKQRIAQKILGFDEKIARQIQTSDCEKFHFVYPSNTKMFEIIKNVVCAAGKRLYPIMGRREAAAFAIASSAAYWNLPVGPVNAMILGGAATVVLPNVPFIGWLFQSRSWNKSFVWIAGFCYFLSLDARKHGPLGPE